MNIKDHFSGQELTQGQEDLVEEIEQFLLEGTCSTFLLKGYAGVGKTFLTIGLTRYLEAEKRQFIIMAPTGKAAKVIANKTKREAKTIHRIIYDYFDKEDVNSNEDKAQEPYQTRSKLKRNEDTPDSVYIVDESSMLSDQYNQSESCTFGSGYLLSDLIKYINLSQYPKRKIIFIGDNAQLPPVRNSFSPALSAKYLNETYQINCHAFELTEVVRQKANSGVIANAKYLREVQESGDFSELSFDTSTDDIHALADTELLKRYFEVCKGQLQGTEDAIVIAYSNKRVRDINWEIRAKLFYPDAKIQVDEKIICVSNYRTEDNFISNGEFGRVTKVLSEIEYRTVEVTEKIRGQYKTKIVDLLFLDVEMEFMNDQGEQYFIQKKVLLNLLYGTIPRLTSQENKALYIDFLERNPNLDRKKRPKEYKDMKKEDPYLNVLQVKFGYAITCHKSQGSEWPHVFVDSYYRNPNSLEYFRWLYTAITRTSRNLYVNKHMNFGLIIP
jgi:ATP-dependent exoDNAse (exonuclease V) alpha subunit